jgi:CTD small phosphatase-like protein 2
MTSKTYFIEDFKMLNTATTIESTEPVCEDQNQICQTGQTGQTDENDKNNESQKVDNSNVFMNSIDCQIIYCLEYFKAAPEIIKSIENRDSMKLLPDKNEFTPEYWLVLDLDETLVHWSIYPFEGHDEVQKSIYISYRPYLYQFLERVGQVFEVVIFTASEKAYANMVLNRIDPGRQFIHHRLFRDSCIPLKGNYVKDLGMLGRDLDKTIIIDNNLLAFWLNVDSAIPIQSFSGDKSDTELYKLIELIDYSINIGYIKPELSPAEQAASDAPNFREYITSVFGLKERISFWEAHWESEK